MKPIAPESATGWAGIPLDDPHTQPDKPARVRAMFASIARAYDLNNRLHSLGRDQAWRRYAARAAALAPGAAVLDAACGTGDLTEVLARTPGSRVVGLDFTPEMLEIAGHKRARLRPEIAGRIQYVQGDAQALPFEGASFDACTIAFGLRNLADPARGIAEMARVLKPGGRLVILEFCTPRNPLVRAFNSFYAGRVMPRTASWIARDRSGAYAYLPRSVATFKDRAQVVAMMEGVGVEHAHARDLTLGICTCFSGTRRASE